MPISFYDNYGEPVRYPDPVFDPDFDSDDLFPDSEDDCPWEDNYEERDYNSPW